MVYVDRFVTGELELPTDLLALEGLGLLLGYADEDDSVAYATLLPNPVGEVVLLLLVVKLVDRNLLPFRQRLYCFTELFRDLSQYHWRRNRLAQLLSHERHQTTGSRQRSDVSIQVQPIQAFYFQRHMIFQQFRNARHDRDSTGFLSATLVGLRSKTSLDYGDDLAAVYKL